MSQNNTLINNRYQIEEIIGQGGMGSVYQGTDTQTGKLVAIKLLRSDVVSDNPEILERFEREGEILRRLNHPNIVDVLGSVSENEQHYIIMEYVSGGSLADIIHQQDKLPLDRVLQIALDVCDALTRAHRLQVIHRDIKPANILLAEDGTPRLTDFGIARVSDRSRITATGSIIGTYAYLSPEACLGEELDERTDIWSLGVVLYEMLAGKRPFEEQNEAAILIAIMQKPHPPLTDFSPDTPPALVSLINRMMEKDSDLRISSIRQVGIEIEAMLRGTPITPSAPHTSSQELLNMPSRFPTPTPTPTPPSTETASAHYIDVTPLETIDDKTVATPPPDVALNPPKNRQWLVGFIGLLLIAVLVVGGLLVFNNDDDGENAASNNTSNTQDESASSASGGQSVAANTPVVVEPVAEDEYMVLVAWLNPIEGATERNITERIADELRNTLEVDIPFSQLRIRTYPQVIETESVAQAAADANDAAVIVWGNYTDDIIELNIQLGDTSAFPNVVFEDIVLERLANVQIELTDERRQSIAHQVIAVVAVLQNGQGDSFELMRSLAISDAIEVTSGNAVGSSVATYLHRFFKTYLEDTDASLEMINNAIALNGTNPALYSYRSGAYFRIGNYEQARADAESALRLAPDKWGIPHSMLGYIAFVDNDLDEAVRQYGLVVEKSPDYWLSYYNLGIGYYFQRDYDAAREAFEKSIELQPSANFPYGFAVLIALREGRIEDAQRLIDDALNTFPDPEFGNRITEALFGREVPNFLGPATSAFSSMVLKLYPEAIQQASEALTINDQFSDLYLIKGFAYCNLGEYEAAEEAYSEGIILDPDYTMLYLLRADVRFKLGELMGNLEDVNHVRNSDLAESFEPVIEAGLAGELSCDNFFDYEL